MKLCAAEYSPKRPTIFHCDEVCLDAYLALTLIQTRLMLIDDKPGDESVRRLTEEIRDHLASVYDALMILQDDAAESQKTITQMEGVRR